jgi:hypothetical protein
VNNQVLVSQIEEVGADIGEPDCKLIQPFVVNTSEQKITIQEGVLTLAPWLSSFTRDDEHMISSDKILTLADPTPTLLEKYLDLTRE